MNKRFVFTVLLILAAIFIAASFIYKSISVKKSGNIPEKARIETSDDVKPKKEQLDSETGERNIEILFSDNVTEDSFLYEIKPKDTLTKIAHQFNTTVELLKKSNKLKSDIIFPGKLIKVPRSKFTIEVDKSDNTLLLLSSGRPFKLYTVSTGENLNTPTGTFYIEEKMVKPVWYKTGAVVDPNSPEYELGSRWMGLSKEGYGIHGTNDESTIGSHITKGCVRMKNSDVEELYAIVPSGTEVIIVE